LRPQLLMGSVGIFIIGTILGCICSGRWLLNGEINIINALASFHAVTLNVTGGATIPTGIIAFWDAIVTALFWDYPFLNSPWCIFIKIPLWLVSIGVIWALIEVFLTVFQGVVSSIRSIISGLR